MKKIILIIIILTGVLIFGQSSNPEIKAELPNVIPPSPTVAALMKFEEVPVNNYTGIPDISVPLFSTSIHDKLNLNLALKYHTYGVKLKEIASDVGLGWSLTGLGSISRSVVGYPDEIYEPEKKIGIYKELSTLPVNQGLNYYNALKVVKGESNNWDLLWEYLWNVDVNGVFDSGHDLWQYNFLGHSGRFIIEKNQFNQLQVVLLDNSKLKIINHYNQPSNTPNPQLQYVPTGFTIFDENGYKYEFQVFETTTVNTAGQSVSQNNNYSESLNTLFEFVSAFHLTSVSYNNQVLIELNYKNGNIETSVSTSYSYNIPHFSAPQLNWFEYFLLESCSSEFPSSFLNSLLKPLQSSSTSMNSYLAKKLDYVDIKGNGKIYFNYVNGRSDFHYQNNQDVPVLKGIQVKDLSNNIINNFVFEHIYYNAIESKLFLKEVKEIKNSQTLKLYDFNYKINHQLSSLTVLEDLWGFCKDINVLDYDVDIVNVDNFVLNSISTPIGGKTNLIYEPNTYSYESNSLLNNFDANPYNWNYSNVNFQINSINTSSNSFQVTNSNNKITFSSGIPNLQDNPDWSLVVFKDNQYHAPLYTFNSCLGGSCTKTLDNLPVGNYTVRLEVFSANQNALLNTFFVNATVAYKKSGSDYMNYLLGGGFRIKKLEYFENVNSTEPTMVKSFFYNNFQNNSLSSGSLVAGKPVYTYEFWNSRIPSFRCNSIIFNGLDVSYKSISTNNIKQSSVTQGSPVGYKNVRVQNMNNSYTQFTYTSPIDFPDENVNQIYQIQLPSISNEFKRGLLLKEESYDDQSRKINESTFDYDFVETNHVTSLKVFGTYQGYNSYKPYTLFDSYGQYKFAKQNNHCQSQSLNAGLYCQFDNAISMFGNLYIDVLPVTDRFGWAKLTSKNTKEYFYINQNTNIVENTEVYEYYNHNKKIKSVTKTDSNNQVHFTQFTYATNINSTHIDNRVAEVESIQNKLNNIETSFVEVIFNNQFGNSNAWLPKFITSSKGNGFTPIENKVQFLKYNLKCKPIEMKQENGMTISYIYAYHHTLPVVKLENIAYDQIPSNLIAAIQQATDTTNYNEQNVVNALNALRTSTDANMQKAMITTYVYKPLVGVTKITDPKGDTQTFLYDTFNRLKEVRDKDNNLLQESEYWYKTQN
jgi:YD repeat-containing protein